MKLKLVHLLEALSEHRREHGETPDCPLQRRKRKALERLAAVEMDILIDESVVVLQSPPTPY
jgi:hypothetical protein